MRVAHMPHVTWDAGKKRAVYQRRFPKDTVALIGRWYRHKYSSRLSQRQAEAISHEQTAEFTALVDAARRRLADPVSRAEALTEAFAASVQQRRQRSRLPQIHGGIAEVWQPLARVDRGIERINEQADLCRAAARLGLTVNLPEPQQRVGAEAVLKVWMDERKHSKRGLPKRRAIQNKRSKLARLFAWKAGHTNLDRRISSAAIDAYLRAGDLGAITEDDLAGYRLYLLDNGGAFDHLADIKALFGVAKRGKFITADPSAEISLPDKQTNPRDSFEAEEAARILRAARDAKPYLRWFNWLAAYSGAIPSELLGASTDQVYQKFGAWVLHIRPPKGGTLKSEYRPRIIPLHRALIREGFLDYWRSLPPGPLFPDAPASARNGLNRFIHDLGIERTFYSWRHLTTDQSDSVVMDLPQGKIPVGPDLARYILGHAMPDVHGAHYLHPESKRGFLELVAAINGLEDLAGAGGDTLAA
jgi:hypothetical protein